MFVPPPPRYHSQATALGASLFPPMIETNNTLKNPSGPEHQFLVGEGLYVLKDDLHLATPPPHPTEAPATNSNPLATSPRPATAGTRLSLVRLDAPSALPPAVPTLSGPSPSPTTGLEKPIREQPSSGQLSAAEGAPPRASSSHTNEGSRAITVASGSPSAIASTHAGSSDLLPTPAPNNAPAFGEGNSLLTTGSGQKDAGRRRKTKNNMTRSNSSFISRVVIHDSLSKRLQDRPTDGLFAFANINRAFQWLDLSSPSKAEHMTKILFTRAHCLCHDVNELTKTASHIELVLAFSTGEIIWWEPNSQRYTRLNKNGIINSTPVSEIRWIPGSETLFMAAHSDGTLVVYDKEKEDAAFSATCEEHQSPGQARGAVPLSASERDGGGDAAMSEGSASDDKTNNMSFDYSSQMLVIKSVHSKNQKSNPVAVWKLSNQRVNAFAFSPDRRHLAVVSEDGSLRIVDYLEEKLLDLFCSYYGGLICVCWSPDAKYVLTGGQDDLLSIWYPAESALIARCQGHHSWVTSVAFDPWRCDNRNYRFGSVGEDCRLCLWDFSVGMLHRPKAASVRQRGSVSRMTLTTTAAAAAAAAINGEAGSDGGNMFPHPVEPRSRTAVLPPIVSKTVDADPLCWLGFTQDAIITSSKTGHVRTWSRPTRVAMDVGRK